MTPVPSIRSGRSLALAVCGLLLASVCARAQPDPLPSWNDGASKQAILAFVHAVTDTSSPKFVPVEERIATFDQDGTTWVSHPMYTQVVYCLERVPDVVKAQPALAKLGPFKTVLSGDRAAMARLGMKDLEAILAATLSRMTVDDFRADVTKWLAAVEGPAARDVSVRSAVPG